MYNINVDLYRIKINIIYKKYIHHIFDMCSFHV